jgi:DNA (cytosine-5)-methyltransferase 1
MLKVLDLFSGIGGFSLGLERTGGFETVALCEIEKFPRKVLAKHWPEVPITGDIRKLSYNRETQELIYDGRVIYVGVIDVITGGFPCQDISVAGLQKGMTDETRSGLWGELLRLNSEIRPSYGLFENVSNLLAGPDRTGKWFARVLSDLARRGYDAEWQNIPASAVGSPQSRQRVWIVAYPRGKRFQGSIFERCRLCSVKGTSPTEFGDKCVPVGAEWPELSAYLRVGDGLSRWSCEIKALGNAVVPQIPEMIGYAILEAEAERA